MTVAWRGKVLLDSFTSSTHLVSLVTERITDYGFNSSWPMHKHRLQVVLVDPCFGRDAAVLGEGCIVDLTTLKGDTSLIRQA